MRIGHRIKICPRGRHETRRFKSVNSPRDIIVSCCRSARSAALEPSQHSSSSLSPRFLFAENFLVFSSVQRPFFPLSSSALSPPSPCQLLDHVLCKQFSRERCVVCTAAGFRVSSMLSSHVSKMMPCIDALQCAVVQFHPLLRPSVSRDDASFLAFFYFQSFAPSSCLSTLLIST